MKLPCWYFGRCSFLLPCIYVSIIVYALIGVTFYRCCRWLLQTVQLVLVMCKSAFLNNAIIQEDLFKVNKICKVNGVIYKDMEKTRTECKRNTKRCSLHYISQHICNRKQQEQQKEHKKVNIWMYDSSKMVIYLPVRSITLCKLTQFSLFSYTMWFIHR